MRIPIIVLVLVVVVTESYSLPAGFLENALFHALFQLYFLTHCIYWFRSHPKLQNITAALGGRYFLLITSPLYSVLLHP